MQRKASPQAQALGDVIRRRRRSVGLTLVRVAEMTGLSHPFLSQLERGRTRGSMRSLFLVAEALGTSQQALLAEATPADESIPVLVSADGGDPMPGEPIPGEGGSGEGGSGTARLLAGLPGQVALTEFCLPPRGYGDFYVHQHQEVLYLVAGSLEVELGAGPDSGAQHHLLRPRDTLRWPGGVPHRFRALGPESSVLLLVHPLGDPHTL